MIPFVDKASSCLAIFFVTLVGAIVPLFISSYYKSKSFNLALGFSGGILLSGGLVHLLPEALKDLEEIKEKTNTSFDIPLCEIFVVLGIFLIIIVEQISDHLIQRKRIRTSQHIISRVENDQGTEFIKGDISDKEKGKKEDEEEEGPNENTCCSKCYNIFFYANKFDYINFLNLIKSKEFENNTMYCINLKDYYNFFSTDKDSVKRICLNNTIKFSNTDNKDNKDNKEKKNAKEQLEELGNIKALKVVESYIKKKLKYKNVPIVHNKNMLMSKLNEGTDDDYTFGETDHAIYEDGKSWKEQLLPGEKKIEKEYSSAHVNAINNCHVLTNVHTNGITNTDTSNNSFKETEIKGSDIKYDYNGENGTVGHTTENNKNCKTKDNNTSVAQFTQYDKDRANAGDIIYFMKTLDNEVDKENIYLENNNDPLNYNFNNMPIILLLAFSFHSIIEGITLGSVKNSLVTSFSIICHKAFASISIGVNLLSRKIKKNKYLLFMFFFSLMTPLGILIGFIANMFAVSSSSSNLIQFFPCILESIGSGTFVYISLFEIIGPLLYTYRIHNHCMHSKKNFHYYKIQHKIQIIMMIMFGAFLMFLLTSYF